MAKADRLWDAASDPDLPMDERYAAAIELGTGNQPPEFGWSDCVPMYAHLLNECRQALKVAMERPTVVIDSLAGIQQAVLDKVLADPMERSVADLLTDYRTWKYARGEIDPATDRGQLDLRRSNDVGAELAVELAGALQLASVAAATEAALCVLDGTELPTYPFPVARYWVAWDRAIGDEDYEAGHQGDHAAAVAQLAGELQEAIDTGGVNLGCTQFQVVSRELLAMAEPDEPDEPTRYVVGWPALLDYRGEGVYYAPDYSVFVADEDDHVVMRKFLAWSHKLIEYGARLRVEHVMFDKAEFQRRYGVAGNVEVAMRKFIDGEADLDALGLVRLTDMEVAHR